MTIAPRHCHNCSCQILVIPLRRTGSCRARHYQCPICGHTYCTGHEHWLDHRGLPVDETASPLKR